MKSIISIFIALLIASICHAQARDGYIISFEHISPNKEVRSINLDDGGAVFMDSLATSALGGHFKTYTNFIGEFAKKNMGGVIAFNNRNRKECGIDQSPEVPADVPYKVIEFDFKNYEKPILIYIYKVSAITCPLTRKDLTQVRGNYGDNVRFVSINKIYSFEPVQECFIDKLKQQLSKFSFGYDGFFDDGVSF
ncbi:MAG: hypothetical protein H3C64_02220 [Candidatus Kuenenia stuttgartiensis]|nr:hypothetical protein [Candidatus Kuenenia stuttgartiensis]